MRIACLPTGPDEYAVAVANALAGTATVELIAPLPMAERYGADLDPRLGLTALPWPRHRDPRNLALIARVRARLHAFRPDVVHFLGDSVSWLALALPLLRRWPLVVTVHDVAYHPGDVQSRRVPMTTVRLLRRAATALVAHGDGLAAELRQLGFDPPAGIHVVRHLALDRHRRLAERAGLRRSPPDGTFRVLFFGRAMSYKGLPVLIEAADRVVTELPRARFVVAGTGPDLDRLRPELARRPFFEVRDRYVPDPEVAQLFLDTDLVVLPYIEASQSGVAALAAAFGVPVVATDTGELGELVRATGMGPVVASGDAAALADAVLGLARAPGRRAACADAARAAAQGPLAPAAIAQALGHVHAAALAGSVRRPRQPAVVRPDRAEPRQEEAG